MTGVLPANIRRCSHRKTGGVYCASPALRDKPYCYFHDRWREQHVEVIDGTPYYQSVWAELPILEDANSIQMSLTKVFHMLLGGLLDPKFAKSLIYCLNVAAQNLPRCNFTPKDEQLGDNAPARADHSIGQSAYPVPEPERDYWTAMTPREKEDAAYSVWCARKAEEDEAAKQAAAESAREENADALPDDDPTGGHDFSRAVPAPTPVVIPNGFSREESAVPASDVTADETKLCHPERSETMAQPSFHAVEGPCVPEEPLPTEDTVDIQAVAEDTGWPIQSRSLRLSGDRKPTAVRIGARLQSCHKDPNSERGETIAQPSFHAVQKPCASEKRVPHVSRFSRRGNESTLDLHAATEDDLENPDFHRAVRKYLLQKLRDSVREVRAANAGRKNVSTKNTVEDYLKLPRPKRTPLRPRRPAIKNALPTPPKPKEKEIVNLFDHLARRREEYKEREGIM